MEWLRKIIDKLFSRNKIKLIEPPKNIVTSIENKKNDFKVMLKHSANVECDDRNGYKIARIYRLKDMV